MEKGVFFMADFVFLVSSCMKSSPSTTQLASKKYQKGFTRWIRLDSAWMAVLS